MLATHFHLVTPRSFRYPYLALLSLRHPSVQLYHQFSPMDVARFMPTNLYGKRNTLHFDYTIRNVDNNRNRMNGHQQTLPSLFTLRAFFFFRFTVKPWRKHPSLQSM